MTPEHSPRLPLLSIVLTVACVVAACGGDPVQPDPEPSIESVELDITTDTLTTFGATTQISATVTDSDGMAVNNAAISWTSSAPSIATVDPTGLVTAVANGDATISATVESASNSLTVTVEVVEELVLSDDFSSGCGQWTATLEVVTGSGDSSESCPSSGGSDGGAYRSMTHFVGFGSHVTVYHVFDQGLAVGAAGSGGLCARTVRFQERHSVTGPAFTGANVAARVIIVQDGVRYLASWHTFNDTGWGSFDSGELTAADFSPTGLDLCPATASFVEFGFTRANSSGGDPYTNTHGVDEWSVTITGVQF